MFALFEEIEKINARLLSDAAKIKAEKQLQKDINKSKDLEKLFSFIDPEIINLFDWEYQYCDCGYSYILLKSINNLDEYIKIDIAQYQLNFYYKDYKSKIKFYPTQYWYELEDGENSREFTPTQMLFYIIEKEGFLVP